MKKNIVVNKVKIAMNWQELLPMYASVYSSLNSTGKKQVQKELEILGAKIDKLNNQ